MGILAAEAKPESCSDGICRLLQHFPVGRNGDFQCIRRIEVRISVKEQQQVAPGNAGAGIHLASPAAQSAERLYFKGCVIAQFPTQVRRTVAGIAVAEDHFKADTFLHGKAGEQPRQFGGLVEQGYDQ